jgi:hypothetical protein
LHSFGVGKTQILWEKKFLKKSKMAAEMCCFIPPILKNIGETLATLTNKMKLKKNTVKFHLKSVFVLQVLFNILRINQADYA